MPPISQRMQLLRRLKSDIDHAPVLEKAEMASALMDYCINILAEHHATLARHEGWIGELRKRLNNRG